MRFKFTISYRLETKNVKAEALSRLFALEESPYKPENILPLNLVVSPIQKSLENRIIEAVTTELALLRFPATVSLYPPTK